MSGTRWHVAGIVGMSHDAWTTKKRTSSAAVRHPLQQEAARLRDTGVSVGGEKRYRSVSGFTLLELLIGMGLFGIVIAVAMPRANTNFALWGANQQFLADLRRTRADALTHGDHFRLDITAADAYVEHRMSLIGAVWVPQDPPVRSRILPSGVTFTSGVGSQFEFNTRGLLAAPEAAGTVGLIDAHSHFTRGVSVWPSGQVAPL